MRLINLSHYQRNKLIAQIQANVAHNLECQPEAVLVSVEPQPYGYPTELHYSDEDGEAVEIGYKCDNCGTVYSSYEEAGEDCECPKCGRPTYENY